MAPVTAPAIELPLYLQMSRYTKGSKAVMELRTERFLADQLAEQNAASRTQVANTNSSAPSSDDQLITGSIGNADDAEGFSFNDLLDAINPLQHLPFISTLYREMTGDEIKPAARIVGGAIFGGPVGAGLAIADAVLEQASGNDSGGHVMALLNGGSARATAQQTAPITPQTLEPAPATPQNASAPAALPGHVPNLIPSLIPSLSPEAFNALLGLAPPHTGSGGRPLGSPSNISEAMGSALDMYNALKEERPH